MTTTHIHLYYLKITIMRSFIAIFFLLACSGIVHAQQKDKDTARYKRDTVLIGKTPYVLKYDSAEFVSRKNLNRYVNRLFGQVAVGADNGADLTNYATFEPLNGSFSFNGFTQINKRTDTTNPVFMSMTFKGGLLNNNTMELFSNSKLNTDVSAQLKLHKGFNKKSITYLSDDQDTLSRRRDSILKKGILRLIKVRAHMEDMEAAIFNDSIRQCINTEKLKEKIAILVTVSNTLKMSGQIDADTKSKYTDSITKLRTDIQQMILDSFTIARNVESLRQELGLKAQRVNKSPYGESRYSQQHYLKVRKELQYEIDSLELKAPLKSARFTWATITLGISRKKFYTYSATKAFGEQIGKEQLDAPEVGLAIHHYSQDFLNGRIFYGNVGFSFSEKNNTALFSTIEVTDENNTSEGAITRKATNKYNAYTDNIFQYSSWLLYAHGYYLFGMESKSAIHLYPEFEIRVSEKSLWNFGVGYIFSFKDKKDGKSILNLEAFIKFIDMGNIQHADSKFYNRNTIGVSVGLPFNYIF